MDPQLFARVPPEVWTIIFEILQDDPISLYNCYKTGSQTWHDILKEDKTKFLFPLIIPSLHKYLKPKRLLSLRGVCKTWKGVMDTILQYPWNDLHPSTPAYRNVHEPEDEWFQNTIGSTFSLPEQIDRFLRKMEDCTGNPFPTRIVKLIENMDARSDLEVNTRLYQSFGRLLEKFGEHIWSCIYFADGDVPESNRQIHSIFQNCPNLRCLTIKKTYHWGDSEDIDNSLDWILKTQDEGMPHLPNLRALNLFLDSQILCNLLLRWYGSQLISCQVELDTIEHIPFFNEPPIERSALKNLRALKIIGVYGDSSLLDRVSQFDIPHLEQLYMNYSEVGRRATNLTSVLQLMNTFSLTLQQLRMPFNLFNLDEHMGNAQDPDFQNLLSVKLPHVKWIGVPYSYIGHSTFDLVMNKFPKLEHLHFMDYDLYVKDKTLEREELHEQTDHFWDQIGPTLRKITVEDERTTRIVFQSTRELCEYRNMLKSFSPIHIEFNDSNNDDDDTSQRDKTIKINF